jgi:hypothetical protein
MNNKSDNWYLSGPLRIEPPSSVTSNVPPMLQIVNDVGREDINTANEKEYGNPMLDGKHIALAASEMWGLKNCYGTLHTWNTDCLFIGLKHEGENRKDAIIAFGDDYNDSLRVLFTPGIPPNIDESNKPKPKELMRIASDGTVGLGTEGRALGIRSPLHIKDITEETPQPSLLLERKGSPRIGFVDTRMGDVDKAPVWFIDNREDRLRIFRQPNIDTGGKEFLTVSNGGNVRIGENGMPWTRLHVDGGTEPFVVSNNDYYFYVGANRDGKDYIDIGAYHHVEGRPKNLVINRLGGNVGIWNDDPLYSLDVKATSIKLGLEGNGGGQLVIGNNADDNRIWLEAFSKDGTTHADELLFTGKHGGNVPQLSIRADKTVINGKLEVAGSVDSVNLNSLRITVKMSEFSPSVALGVPGKGLTEDIGLLISNAQDHKAIGLWIRGDSDKISNLIGGSTTFSGPATFSGTLRVTGSLNNNSAKQILGLMSNYTVIISVEEISQGNNLVFYWKDGNGVIRKGWVSGQNM